LRVRLNTALHPLPVPMVVPAQRDADSLLESTWRLRVAQNESRRAEKRRPRLRVVESPLPIFLRRQAE
jgi:hypothetical protein